MAFQLGFIDSGGHPRLRIRVRGTKPKHFTDDEALVDTGFTGFLMLPVAKALPLGLVLIATGNYTIADGSTVTNFVASGTVTVGPEIGIAAPFLSEETVEGSIVPGGDTAILGMGFLRSLDKLLVVGKTVALLEHSILNDWLKSVADAHQHGKSSATVRVRDLEAPYCAPRCNNIVLKVWK